MSVFETISRPLFNGGVFRTDLLAKTHYFYCTFNTGSTPKDKISMVHIQTTGLAAGRVSYHGGTYGINEPTIDTYGLFGCGAFTVLNGKSNDISNDYWDTDATILITGTNEIQATAQGDRIRKTINTTAGKYYTLSFYAHVEPGGKTSGYQMFHYFSDTSHTSALTLSETRKRYHVTVLGAASGGVVSFGFRDNNPDNWSKIYIDTINVTEGSLLCPPVINDTTTALAIPENFSDADQGYKFDNEGQLFTALNGTDGTDAQGKITVKWRPMFNSGDLAGSINIITSNDEASSFLLFDADNDLLKLTDGTNTSQVACSHVADTEYEITAQYDETNGMVISLNGLAGTTVEFAGMFPNADDLSFFWEADAPQYVKILSIEKESGL